MLCRSAHAVSARGCAGATPDPAAPLLAPRCPCSTIATHWEWSAPPRPRGAGLRAAGQASTAALGGRLPTPCRSARAPGVPGAPGPAAFGPQLRRSATRATPALHRMVVLPALSSPSTRMRASFSPKKLKRRLTQIPCERVGGRADQHASPRRWAPPPPCPPTIARLSEIGRPALLCVRAPLAGSPQRCANSSALAAFPSPLMLRLPPRGAVVIELHPGPPGVPPDRRRLVGLSARAQVPG